MNRNEKILLKNEKGQQIEFSVWSSFFIEDFNKNEIRNTIHYEKGMLQDGATFTNSNLEIKNIVIQGIIREEKELNKDKLYNILRTKQKLKLYYYNKFKSRCIDCYLENIICDKKYKFQISLLCPNPFWKDIEENKNEIALWKGDFHFPLVINKTTGIIMGHREPSLIVNVENKGQIKTGMIIEFKAKGSVVNPSLFNINTREFIKINKKMIAGEIIKINTNYGSKKIESSNNGITTDILNYIDLIGGGDTFLQLDIGDNLFRYDADENLNNLEVTIYYNNNYLGV